MKKFTEKKRVLACVIAAAMVISLAACESGKTAGTDSKPETTVSQTNTSETSAAESKTGSETETGSASDSSEASSQSEEGGETKEWYDSLDAEALKAKLSDPDNKVTADEMVWLINTYRFVDIEDDPAQTNYISLKSNVTDEVLNSLEYDVRPNFTEYVDVLLSSEYPQIRGYAFSHMSSLFGVSDDNLNKAKDVLKTEEDPYVLYCAMSALSNSLADDPDIAAFAYKMAESENPKLRYRAALAFGNSWTIGVEGAVDQIIKMMDDENEDVRAVACQYSGRLNDEKVIDPLVAIINNDSESTQLKSACVRGLFTLWYDYPFHKNTSEKAYNATMDYFKKTPRSNDQPYWAVVSLFADKAESSYDEWKANAAYYKPDDICALMNEFITDENVNWMARTSAVQVVKKIGTEQQFADLKAVVDGLTDKNAKFVQDEYARQAEAE